jgi:CRISPR-associated endonuclease Csn1
LCNKEKGKTDMSQDSKKTILGLDLGTNSIGWALVETDFNNKEGSIIGLGSRIIPMGQDTLSEFGKGGKVSQTAERTRLRITRRLRERHLLRRARLHRVLNILGFLPEHYSSNIDFENKLGQFKSSAEPKLAYIRSSENAPHEFIFRSSFSEMLEDFKKRNPKALVSESGNAVRIPQDWTLYYLRKKALRERIEKEELAWIILNFNQKRGYYQARGEDDVEVTNKSVDYYALKVVDVKLDNDNKKKGEQWYSIILENGWVYRRSSKVPMFDWVGLTKEFIVTTELNEDGGVKKNKEGEERRSFRAPSEEDWTLLKKKTESEILKSGLTVGEFAYENLVQEPKSKIRGKLIRTIERRFYKEELERILLKQKEFHPELTDELLYANVVRDLYRNNETHRAELSGKDVVHLILKDVIFYQRPLRSQKGTISECQLEIRTYTTKTGQLVQRGIKVTPKSNPLFQEFRVLQWVQNLAIYTNDNSDRNVNSEILDPVRDELIEYLMSRASIDQSSLIKFLLTRKGLKVKQLTAELVNYRWNYVQDKEYPCNETRSLIRTKLSKVVGAETIVLDDRLERALWHLIYSVTDREQYIAGLKKFARKNGIDQASFVESFKRIAPFKSDYAAFSEKAVNKLLQLMRRGNSWKWELIPEKVKQRIQRIIDGEFDTEIKDRVREKALHLKLETDFSGLPLWLAQYIVYNRHSETAFAEVWRSPEDVSSFLKEFRQHTLRNPIVEQVVTETLRVIRDIWQHYGKGKSDYFREVHIELGREMKSPANDREQMTKRNTENENKNQTSLNRNGGLQ